ncbi:hypothetical protein GH714_021266 [Hevea brasiliensis]|uniref:PGG domain-containing protein n=1 Tax=Hevea brasiliensis TaxID=3981 RepID=A0A6A6LQH8_HEVBR|nr:hypothetical protein GH714_021266 [Hevea brasiliensis]
MNLAADEFFNRVNSELRSAGKEWLKSTAEGCSVVAVLIATVAFAAAYTVPGGNQSNGLPVLLNHPLFVVFTVTDEWNAGILLLDRSADQEMVSIVNDDTVLHMATYAKEAELALKLLEDLPEYHLDKMTRQNGIGNTILHEAATTNLAVHIAEKLLKKAPGLLGMRNFNGETALFRAARFGKTDIFNCLAGKISGYDLASRQFYFQRSDKTTVLHISFFFSTSYYLARKSSEAKANYVSAVELAKFLVRRDLSWEDTHTSKETSKPKIHKYSSMEKRVEEELPTNIMGQIEGMAETPLILAAKSGCLEIVEEIIKLYPQAVEHIDDEGRNILHVAIKYRQLKIFELVTGMDVPMRRLVQKVDNEGNTILHTVAIKRKTVAPETTEGPAILLQQELLWFERVKALTPPHFLHHRNDMKLAPYPFFTEANSELRNMGKEWLKRTSEGCSVVAVLIATVAFAAAYTVPGGPNQSTGFPVLLNQPFFVFTVTDVLSLTFALTSVVTFLSILSSSFRFQDFKHSLPTKLMMGFTFLFLQWP